MTELEAATVADRDHDEAADDAREAARQQPERGEAGQEQLGLWASERSEQR